MNWPVFFTRLGSAIVFAAIMMFGLLGHLWTGSVYGIIGLALLIQFQDLIQLGHCSIGCTTWFVEHLFDNSFPAA